MLKQKLTSLLHDCYWLLEKTVEAPQELRQMQEQLTHRVAELEGRETFPGTSQPVGEGKRVA
ncbi:MAG: hypothetical protein PWQ18_1066 [Clostridia bacterium]|nr:hypothetical protein [Clostridia bacterium]